MKSFSWDSNSDYKVPVPSKSPLKIFKWWFSLFSRAIHFLQNLGNAAAFCLHVQIKTSYNFGILWISSPLKPTHSYSLDLQLTILHVGSNSEKPLTSRIQNPQFMILWDIREKATPLYSLFLLALFQRPFSIIGVNYIRGKCKII